MAKKVVFLKDARTFGTSVWTVPNDFSSVNSIHCIAGGGSGGNGGSDGAAGGGGGAYSRKNNVNLTPGSTVRYRVGAGGIAEEGDGGDTWFGATTYGAALCAARGGKNPEGIGSSNKTGGLGGQASEGIGDVKYSGGQGNFPRGESPGGGGGGAAGPGGNGKGGTTTRAGGDAGGGPGTGATTPTSGSMLEVWTQTSNGEKAGPGGGGWEARTGGFYGGGGGGEGDVYGQGANGAQGIIVIEYEAAEHNTRCWIVG